MEDVESRVVVQSVKLRQQSLHGNAPAQKPTLSRWHYVVKSRSRFGAYGLLFLHHSRISS